MKKNWKTTVAGVLTGAAVGINAVVAAYQAGAFSSDNAVQLLVALGITLMGAYAKDHNVTGGAAQ